MQRVGRHGVEVAGDQVRRWGREFFDLAKLEKEEKIYLYIFL
jgi:hypothetical protein